MTNDLARTTYIAGLGTLPMNLTTRIVELSQQVGADVFFAAAIANENRTEEGALEDALFDLLGDRWIGPTIDQIRQSSGFHSDEEIANATQEDWIPHLRRMVDLLCQDSWNRNLELPFGLTIFSPPFSGHYTLAKWFFHQLSERALNAVRLGITALPHEDVKRRMLAATPNFIDEMMERGKLQMVLVFDNRGPVARKHTYKYQDALVTNGLTALWAAQVFSRTSSTTASSAADVVNRLKRYGKYLGMGFGLKGLIVLDQPEPEPQLQPAQPPAFPPKRNWLVNLFRALFGMRDPLPEPVVYPGNGRYDLVRQDDQYYWVWTPEEIPAAPPVFHLKDTILQVKLAVEMALTDPEWRAIDIDGEVPTDPPVYMVISLPMQIDDPAWNEVVGEVENHFSNERSNLNWVWAPMNGCGIPLDPAEYRVQATALFPMGEVKPLNDIVETEERLLARNS
jgi:hypothetical protein